MKKFPILFFSFIMLFSIINVNKNEVSAATKKHAIGSFYWGDSMKTVKKKEKRKLITSSKTLLAYKTKALGYNAKLVYEFSKSKLTSVYYLLEMPDEYYTFNELGYLHDELHAKLKKNLKTKSNGLFVSDHYFTQSTFWEFKTREVFLLLTNENIETEVSIVYQPN